MPTIAKRTVPIEHIRIQSTKSFIDVRAALERIVPPLDPTILELLAKGDVEGANSVKANGPELSIFLFVITARCCKSRVGRERRCNMTSATQLRLAYDEISTCGSALCADPGGALRR
jgi:hypothetical protein